MIYEYKNHNNLNHENMNLVKRINRYKLIDVNQ